MVRAVFFLAISVVANAQDDSVQRMITNKDHSGQCVYCHGDGDMQMYQCDEGYDDQKFVVEKVPPADVGNRTNGYVIRSADNNLCLATTFNAKIFGWEDCSTSNQGGNGDRSWLFTQVNGGVQIESARYPGSCMATQSGWNLFKYPCGNDGQTWYFTPDFVPDGPHGSVITQPVGLWVQVASNNADISQSFAYGMSYTDSTTVTQTDQIGFSYALETSGEFLGMGAKETLSLSYAHTWSRAVMSSTTMTTETTCTATCKAADLPEGAAGWNLMQWEMHGTAPHGVLSTRTCDFLCLPQPKQPQCPLNCCEDKDCQICLSSCFSSGAVIV